MTIEEGWYRDPKNPKAARYWNGSGWTLRTQPLHCSDGAEGFAEEGTTQDVLGDGTAVRQGEGRRAVHTYLSVEAHGGWEDLATKNGVSVPGLLEYIGLLLRSLDDVEISELVQTAKEVDGTRRGRESMLEKSQVADSGPDDGDDNHSGNHNGNHSGDGNHEPDVSPEGLGDTRTGPSNGELGSTDEPRSMDVSINHARVLSCIAISPDITGREIAHLVDIADDAVWPIIAELVEDGRVVRTRDGLYNRYSLNPDELAALVCLGEQ